MSLIAGAAAGVALMDFLGGRGQKLSITDNIVSDMTVNAVSQSSTECFQQVSSDQTIEINTGGNSSTDGISQACEYCLQALNTIKSARVSLEQDAALKNPGYTVQVANADLETAMETGGASSSDPNFDPSNPPQLGACTAVCADNVLFKSSQTIQLKATQDCSVTTDISTDVQQNLQEQISSYLKNQQDIFGQLESGLSSTTEKISANLASVIQQNVTQNFTQDLTQALSAFQSQSLSGDSILAVNILQTFTGQMVGSLKVSNSVTDQLRQSADYSITQSLINKNDTLGDLSKSFLSVINSMSELLEDLTTQILVIIGAVIVGVVLVVGTLFVFNQTFHSWMQDRLSNNLARYPATSKQRQVVN
jgi:hypothetical protein